MIRTRIVVLALAASYIASGQGVPGGTIDGKSIPASVFASSRPCDDLHDTIRRTAREQAIKDLGVTVTEQEKAAFRAKAHFPDPVRESQRVLPHETMMISALTAVDRGQDQHQVYQQMLQPKGIGEQEWASYLVQWKNPEQKAVIEKRLTFTPEVIAKQIAETDVTPAVTNEKLNAAVDEQLAQKDPKFRTVLDHWNASQRHMLLTTEKAYMDEQLAQYWRARESKLHVVLNDQSLYAKCGVAGAVK